MRCPACGLSAFPRLAPAMITLVTRGDDGPEQQALLARGVLWKVPMYSCLAGFVEPGETLEEAVRREVLEESRVRVDDVAYVASQPWPFPSSLMIGFSARAGGGEPQPADGELVEVRWLEREEVQTAIGEDLSRAVGPDDVVLLYFACHGSPEMRASKDERSLYLILHDTQYQRIYATGIDMEVDVMRWMDRLGDAKLVVLFIDACFSGRAGGRTFKGPLATKAYRSEPRKVSLKDLALGSGRLIITAADEDQVALEDPRLGHGVFTYHLLRALQPTSAEATTIRIGALYEAVATAVAQATEGRQVPILNGQSRMAALPALPAP